MASNWNRGQVLCDVQFFCLFESRSLSCREPVILFAAGLLSVGSLPIPILSMFWVIYTVVLCEQEGYETIHCRYMVCQQASSIADS